MAGHSLGEYSALVAAGSLKFSDAVKIVHKRGKYMQEAVPAGEGAMAAIMGLSHAVVHGCVQARRGGSSVLAREPEFAGTDCYFWARRGCEARRRKLRRSWERSAR